MLLPPIVPNAALDAPFLLAHDLHGQTPDYPAIISVVIKGSVAP